jgi:hypothetical protein
MRLSAHAIVLEERETKTAMSRNAGNQTMNIGNPTSLAIPAYVPRSAANRVPRVNSDP